MSQAGNVSVSDLMNIPMNQVAERRREVLPVMKGLFQCEKVEMEDGEIDNDPIKIVFVHFVVAQVQWVDPKWEQDGGDREKLMGRKQIERIWIRELDDFGDVRAVAFDLGLEDHEIEPMSLGVLFQSMAGRQAPGETRHRPDKNDKSRVYCNLNLVNRRKVAVAA